MGEDVRLAARDRVLVGKKVRRLRREGLVPAIIYGAGMESKAITLDAIDATKAWRDAGRRRAVEVKMSNSRKIAMISAVDFDPVTHKIRHLSLLAVKRNEKVQAEVPVKVTGEGQTEAEKAGLILLKNTDVIEISALPKCLPDFLEVPGDKLVEQGDSLKVADIASIENVEILSDPEKTIVTVYEPSALAAANESEVVEESGGEQPKEGEELEVSEEDKEEAKPEEGKSSEK